MVAALRVCGLAEEPRDPSEVAWGRSASFRSCENEALFKAVRYENSADGFYAQLFGSQMLEGVVSCLT